MVQTDSELYIGLMSGTSLDAMDAVLVDLTSRFPTLVGQISLPYPSRLRNQLNALCQPGANEIEAMCEADLAVAILAADSVSNLLDETGHAPQDIAAIGSHGQTIRHMPQIGNTLQIGNPSLIAEQTGITTVADFRRRDMAAGGEGAPLVPAFHEAVFRHPEKTRIIANIGGIANITILPPAGTNTVIGFDTGPGNTLMDDWCYRHSGRRYDQNGQWAASGKISAALLSTLLSDSYFSRPPPKSTGREYFHHAWLWHGLSQRDQDLSGEDVQATLAELTARTIADAIALYAPDCEEVFVCGGGARNATLMSRLVSCLEELSVNTTDAIGLAPQWVEAAAFAWLAQQTLLGLPGNLPAVTNASGRRILGGVYPA
ncbi:anhydro-N-acetylmuramic acid kinase [Sansalvadorimonas sp. 2012CJ34-2]|uniref:Anhydro-N-acetylmuramic acid kinase n=1 Tax=Parendozoicomonas callyspongiae TaxID=2942213 RepID=A0ABT0PGL7_9GAMM|nr:anhydro-N-acetylmuramic acid kinase [Sansalvadorimonas sp. 2012CJ34-2]MCL6270494.1 anhydro-N-acetylmuramic acid kinase [Sansalvadorimonas sp. 2012CJ34-2]